MNPLLSTCAALALAAAAPAQCLFTSVSTQSIGPSCNVASTGFCAIVSLPTVLEPVLDTNACTLSIRVVAFSGCGASIPLCALALGTQQAAVPLPEFGFGCTLHVAPVVLLASTGAAPFVLPLPPNVPSLSFLVQGAALSSFPLGGPDVLTFSDGVAIGLQ